LLPVPLDYRCGLFWASAIGTQPPRADVLRIGHHMHSGVQCSLERGEKGSATHDEQATMMGQQDNGMHVGENSAGCRRPRTALVFLANLITRLLPPSRCYQLKAFLYRSAGYQVSRSCQIISSAQVWGNCEVMIGDDTFIGHEVLIVGGESRIEIGRFVDIGPRVCIAAGTHVIDMRGPHSAGAGYSKDIFIEDGVWIGANSTILGGVRLGRRCVIGAGSVVNRDIPPFTLALGVPCRAVKIWNQEDERWDPANLTNTHSSCQT
jgi:acetyltransferase-like isoleucine patch superfamily enzyme